MVTHMDDKNDIILEVKDLKLYFPIYRGLIQRVVGHCRAVDGVSFSLRDGEVLGLVGESGCGKTTVGRTLLRLYDPTAGEIWYNRSSGERIDLARISQKKMKPLRRELRMIFQDPFSSLNPRLTVKDIISEPLEIHKVARGKKAEQRGPIDDSAGVSATTANLKGFACEYMTSGRVLILGDPGPYAFAGMTGGVVYQHLSRELGLDEAALQRRIARGAKVRIAPLDDDDIPQVQELLDHYIAALEQTAQYDVADRIAALRQPAVLRGRFVKVVPVAVPIVLPGQGGSTHP